MFFLLDRRGVFKHCVVLKKLRGVETKCCAVVVVFGACCVVVVSCVVAVVLVFGHYCVVVVA